MIDIILAIALLLGSFDGANPKPAAGGNPIPPAAGISAQ
jgi:hypothetical protein